MEKKININEKNNAAEFAQLIGQLKPELMPLVRGYLHYLAEQEKRQKVERLCSNGDIWKSNSTMAILRHQPVDNGCYGEMVPEILNAFGETLNSNNFYLFFSVFNAGVLEGIHRERERRRHIKHSA